MSDSDPEDELAKLLGELADTEPLPSQPKSKGSKSEPKDKDEDLDKDLILLPAVERKHVEIKKDPPTMMLQNDAKELPEIVNDQIKKVFSQYGAVFEDIVQNYIKDREQAQEVIDRFMEVISAGGKVPRVYLEKVADAVRAKNEIAQTAIKALDSLPKLMSATKNNEIFNQVNMSFDVSDLKNILETSSDD